jgi:hypothetical protein
VRLTALAESDSERLSLKRGPGRREGPRAGGAAEGGGGSPEVALGGLVGGREALIVRRVGVGARPQQHGDQIVPPVVRPVSREGGERGRRGAPRFRECNASGAAQPRPKQRAAPPADAASARPGAPRPRGPGAAARTPSAAAGWRPLSKTSAGARSGPRGRQAGPSLPGTQVRSRGAFGRGRAFAGSSGAGGRTEASTAARGPQTQGQKRAGARAHTNTRPRTHARKHTHRARARTHTHTHTHRTHTHRTGTTTQQSALPPVGVARGEERDVQRGEAARVALVDGGALCDGRLHGLEGRWG